jgi:hypothetical protein
LPENMSARRETGLTGLRAIARGDPHEAWRGFRGWRSEVGPAKRDPAGPTKATGVLAEIARRALTQQRGRHEYCPIPGRLLRPHLVFLPGREALAGRDYEGRLLDDRKAMDRGVFGHMRRL